MFVSSPRDPYGLVATQNFERAGMKPARFEYHSPTSVDETVALLASFGDDAKVLGGGQSLVPMLALRLTRFAHLIDLNRIPTLQFINREWRMAVDRSDDEAGSS